ncbi:MAG: hypothetical protein Q9162_002595 [Coniocarpon cinnabarinum]
MERTYSSEAIDNLRIIHVAGTTGKGSTCAFTEALLAAYSRRTGFSTKYGSYTSPPLREEAERIRINSEQMSKDQFAKYIFEVWDNLTPEYTPDDSMPPLPRYLQLMLLACIHAFIKEGVQVAVLETHHGGEYDSTNIFRHPVATAVTSLGMDHVAQLGPTISDIAWHKAGIFKRHSPAFASGEQPEAARPVLTHRAALAHTSLQFVKRDADLPLEHPALQHDVQRLNLSLAKALVQCYLQSETAAGSDPLTSVDISKALDVVHLPGRFQRLECSNIKWFLDGAHNLMSIGKAVSWYASETQDPSCSSTASVSTERGESQKAHSILAFSHISSERDGQELMQCLIDCVKNKELLFDDVIFCYDGVREDGSLRKGKSESPIM